MIDNNSIKNNSNIENNQENNPNQNNNNNPNIKENKSESNPILKSQELLDKSNNQENKTNPNLSQKNLFNIYPIDYFLLSLLFLFISCDLTTWCKYSETFLSFILLLFSLFLYFFAIFRWYEGKSMRSLLNFFFSLLTFSIFLSNYEINGIQKVDEGLTYFQMTFYFMLFVTFGIITMSSYLQGMITVISYFLTLLGFGVIGFWKVSEYKWAKIAGGYIFFLCSLGFFYVAIGRTVWSLFKKKIFPLV